MIYSIVKNSFSGNLDFDVLSIELKLDVFLYLKETAIKAVCPFLLSQILYLTLLNQSLPLGILHLEYLHLYVLIGLIPNHRTKVHRQHYKFNVYKKGIQV